MPSPETLYMFPSSMVRSDELDSFGDHLKERKFVAWGLPDTKGSRLNGWDLIEPHLKYVCTMIMWTQN